MFKFTSGIDKPVHIYFSIVVSRVSVWLS